MRTVSYEYIFNKLVRALPAALLCGVIGATALCGYKYAKSDNHDYTSKTYTFYVDYLEVPSEISNTSFVVEMTADIAMSFNSTWQRDQFLTQLEGTKWEGKYSNQDLNNFWDSAEGLQSFDIFIDSGDSELNDYLGELITGYYDGIDTYMGYPVHVEGKDVSDTYSRPGNFSSGTVRSFFKKREAVIGFGLGFVFLMGVVFVIARLNSTVKGKNDLKMNTNLNVLTMNTVKNESEDKVLSNLIRAKANGRKIALLNMGLSSEEFKSIKERLTKGSSDNVIAVDDISRSDFDFTSDNLVLLVAKEEKTSYRLLEKAVEMFNGLNNNIDSCILVGHTKRFYEIEC